MASMKTTICFSLAILAAAFITTTSAGSGSFCNSADDKALCKQLVNGAKNWEAAMTNAINAVLAKANAGKSTADVIASKLPGNLRPQTKESITSTCHEAYANIIDNLQQCLGFVKNDPDSSLRTYLSAVTYSDCTDGLEEFGFSVPEATQFSDEILKLSSTLLAVAEKKKKK